MQTLRCEAGIIAVGVFLEGSMLDCQLEYPQARLMMDLASEFAACGKEFESFQEIVERDAKKGQLYCTGKSLIYLARGARS